MTVKELIKRIEQECSKVDQSCNSLKPEYFFVLSWDKWVKIKEDYLGTS